MFAGASRQKQFLLQLGKAETDSFIDTLWQKLYCPNVCRRQPAKKIVFFCNLAKLKLPLLMIPNGNLKWQKNLLFLGAVAA